MKELSVTIVLFVLCQCANAQLSANEYSSKGNAELKAGQYSEAIQSYTEAIELGPDDPVAFYNRGICYALLKDHQSANRDFTKAIELKSDYASAFFKRGLTYRLLKDDQSAIRDYTKAIELGPDDPGAFFSRGISYAELKDDQSAIRDFTKAIELKSDDASAFYNRGISYAELKDDQSAIRDFTKSIELKSDNAGAFYNRGISYARLKDNQSAIRDYTDAIELFEHPDLRGAFAGLVLPKLGYCYLEEGILDLAEQSFSRCLLWDSTSWNASLGLALLYFQKSDMPNARKYLAMASAVEPRLKDGMTGIEKLESEGWSFSESGKQSLRQLFEATNNIDIDNATARPRK